MPRIVITHAVQDVERWLRGVRPSAPYPCQAPRASLTLWPWMGATTRRVFDFDDLDALKAVLSSVPPEMAAQAESHGVIMPMTAYVEA